MVPVITTLLAFLIAGLVVLVTTGHNPLSTYRAIFNGTGLVWFFHPGSYSIGIPFTEATVWFPWDTNSLESRDAYALQQTLLLTTTLIFTGLAVAFAFRCGLFNIGGQGQYIAGSLAAVWVGSSFASMAQFPHVVLGIAAAALAGALLAGIAGFLKATVGAHEVVVTIMLNWIMYWTGQWLLGADGPLNANIATSTSEDGSTASCQSSQSQSLSRPESRWSQGSTSACSRSRVVNQSRSTGSPSNAVAAASSQRS